jgi:hypothetical protein
MHDRSSKKKTPKTQGPPDVNSVAFRVMREATGQQSRSEEPPKNPAAVALGRLGGAKGGPARANVLSEEKRKEIASKAAAARWHKAT